MFNVDSGYLEGLVRGFKSGILKQTGKSSKEKKKDVMLKSCNPSCLSFRVLYLECKRYKRHALGRCQFIQIDKLDV